MGIIISKKRNLDWNDSRQAARKAVKTGKFWTIVWMVPLKKAGTQPYLSTQ